MKHVGRMLACLALLLFVVPSAFAQFDTASVVGTVKLRLTLGSRSPTVASSWSPSGCSRPAWR